jgi:hypothetical protein
MPWARANIMSLLALDNAVPTTAGMKPGSAAVLTRATVTARAAPVRRFHHRSPISSPTCRLHLHRMPSLIPGVARASPYLQSADAHSDT